MLYGVVSQYNIVTLSFISFSIFICAVYSIWLYNKIIFGLPNYNFISLTRDLTKNEFMLFVPIILGTTLLGIYPKLFLDIFIFNIYYYFNYLIY